MGVLGGCVATSPRYRQLHDAASRAPDEPWASRPSSEVLGYDEILRSGDHAPKYLAAPELILDEFVADVLRRNPTLAAAQHAWQSAVARYPQVTALNDPQFSYGIAPGSIGSDSVDFGQRLELSQRLPWPGKRELRGEVALSEAEARGEELRAARDRLAYEAKAAYFHYYFVYRAIEVNETNKVILEEFQRTAETRYAAGTASKQDALQAEVAYNHLLHRSIVLERMRRVAQGRLNALLSRRPTAEIPPPPQALESPADRRPFEELLDLSLSARPELVALAHRLEGKEAALKLAHKEFYPDFTVMGGYNSLWQDDDLRPMVGVGINIPLQRSSRHGAVDEAKAEALRLRAQIADLAATVALEVQESYELVVEGEHVVNLYSTVLVPAAQENLDAARSEYTAGAIDFLSLLAAERGLMEALLAYQEALSGYHERVAGLEQVVGRSVSETQGGRDER